ncbi:tetratricopeptide repeat-containing sensor histidine kinase [Rheinheimera texasensis]|uniref:tetratricopeptide repeat-containing sensor histidine kinase n=1 Tax=Rheinheimera texasensis TaxID=306205 RepID=UPI0004E15A5A|nr:tetratricopeptide repeat protein [Rheinheimera texasensis]
MKYCCYGLLALLSLSVTAMPEADFEKLRGPLLKGAAINYSQAVRDTDQLLQQHQLNLTLEQQIRLNYHKAIFQERSNQTEAALKTLAWCKSMSLESKDRSILYSYHNILAGIFREQGLYQQAITHYQQALSLATLLAKPFFISQTENNLALALLRLGQTHEATQYFQRFYQQALRDNSPSAQAVALNNLGEAALQSGAVSAAEQYHQQALAIRGLHQLEASWSFFNLARVALAQQDGPRAVLLARHSLQLRQSRHAREQAEAGLLLVQALLLTGDSISADRQLQQSLQLATELRAHDQLLQGWQLQADLALRQQKYAQAVVAMQQALKAQQQLADQRFSLTVAQQSAEVGISTREIEIQRLQQQQQISQSRQQQLYGGIAAVLLILLVSLGFSWQIRRKNRALAHSLETLERTRQQLVEQRKLAALTQLVSGMAHQLNTPLGTILTAVSCSREQLQLLLQKLTDKKLNLQELQQFIDEQQQLMALTEQSAERTAGLVERFKLISATSPQSGVDTQLVLQFAGQWLHSHLALQPREVTLELEGADLQWRFDTNVLGKVLSALLDNALQHAEPTAGALQIRLQLATEPDGTQLLLYFSDNGQGIRPELLDKIFDPFFTTKLGQGNLGLGLNIAYNQLQAIGGCLEHLPQPSSCCFLVRLPAL